jgi:heptosyltransferase-2
MWNKAGTKILIIQTAYLGDVILTLPIVQSLKKLMPDSFIDFLCIPSTANVLENNILIRNVIRYDKRNSGLSGLLKIISKIRKERYNIVICPHRSFRSALLTYCSYARIKIGFNRNLMSFLLTRKVNYDRSSHEIQRNLELVKNIPGIRFTDPANTLKPELFPSDNDKLFVDKLLSSASSSRLITFAPCSKWFTKQLPLHKSAEIVKAFINSGNTVILIGGADDIPYCRNIEKEITGSPLMNLCGRLTPLQSTVIIGRSRCLISVDSAAAHLCASTDTPIIQIYGSTVPAFGFYPLTSKNVIIENGSLSCRPCTDHGKRRCPLKHFKCMEDLSAEDIVHAAIGLDQSF